MSTKVIDLELTRLPAEFAPLPGYDHALFLFRFEGVPVGQATLPLRDGRFHPLELHDAVNRLENWSLWEHKSIAAPAPPIAAPAPPPVTVAVCTRDRPADLRRCLDAFLQLPDDGQEYLIVDNAPSTAATRELVAGYDGRFRYVHEPRPGLNVARNRALREAAHDIVAFNDDDAVPDPGWLRALLAGFTDPDIVCVTGLTMPLELETPAQEWFERYSPFNRGFRPQLFHGNPVTALRAGHAGAGANMALRRATLDRIGGFDELLDAGTPTLSGGDTEMFARILAAGFHIQYTPAALTWHRHRRTWPELRRVAYGYGVGTYAMWTRRLLVDHELGVLRAAWQHFRWYQLPLLARALRRRPGHMPLDILLQELRGCLVGSRAYFRSRRQARRRDQQGQPA